VLGVEKKHQARRWGVSCWGAGTPSEAEKHQARRWGVKRIRQTAKGNKYPLFYIVPLLRIIEAADFFVRRMPF